MKIWDALILLQKQREGGCGYGKEKTNDNGETV